MDRTITRERLEKFERILLERDRMMKETIKLYIQKVECFAEYLNGREVTQEILDGYKPWLLEEKNYKKSSANAYVLSARSFCDAMDWGDLQIHAFTLDYKEKSELNKYLTKEEYTLLVKKALELGKYRIALLIQTLCHVNIRFSELPSLTVEAVKTGYLDICRWRHNLQITIPDYLRESLLVYAKKKAIYSGLIFRTAKGKPWNRSNAWKEFKKLCALAGIDGERVTLQMAKMPEVKGYYPYYSLE